MNKKMERNIEQVKRQIKEIGIEHYLGADFLPFSNHHNKDWKENLKNQVIDVLTLTNEGYDNRFYTYKCRAEFLSDIKSFVDIMGNDLFNMIIVKSDMIFCDVDIIFQSRIDITILKNALKKLDNKHVMIETLDLYNNYDGKR